MAETEASCAICSVAYDSLVDKKRPFTICECGHTFCFGCILQMMVMSPKCFLCRIPHKIKKSGAKYSGICRNYALDEFMNKRAVAPPAPVVEPPKQVLLPDMDEDIPSRVTEQAFYCTDCFVDFYLDPNEGNHSTNSHFLHKWVCLSSCDPEELKKIKWMFDLIKNDNFDFLRSKIMVSGLIESLSTVRQ